jgi:hypothetical protein
MAIFNIKILPSQRVILLYILKYVFQAEAVCANTEELALSDRITTEKNIYRALAAEAKLTSDISAESKARSDYDTNLTTSLAVETRARQSADSKIANDLVFETARAVAQEDVLSGLISAEEKSRMDADTKLAE